MSHAVKWLVVTVAIVVVAFFWFKHSKQRSLWHAGVIESRLELHRAIRDIEETGGLRDHGNDVQPYIFTNSVTVDGTTYACAVAYDDPKFYGGGFLAATTNYVFIYLDKKRGPKLIPTEGRF